MRPTLPRDHTRPLRFVRRVLRFPASMRSFDAHACSPPQGSYRHSKRLPGNISILLKPGVSLTSCADADHPERAGELSSGDLRDVMEALLSRNARTHEAN